MNTVSMLDLRQDAEQVLNRIQAGEHLILTYRGKPVARLEPVLEDTVAADDPFYRLDDLADPGGVSLDDRAIDVIVYGQ